MKIEFSGIVVPDVLYVFDAATEEGEHSTGNPAEGRFRRSIRGAERPGKRGGVRHFVIPDLIRDP